MILVWSYFKIEYLYNYAEGHFSFCRNPIYYTVTLYDILGKQYFTRIASFFIDINNGSPDINKVKSFFFFLFNKWIKSYNINCSRGPLYIVISLSPKSQHHTTVTDDI